MHYIVSIAYISSIINVNHDEIKALFRTFVGSIRSSDVLSQHGMMDAIIASEKSLNELIEFFGINRKFIDLAIKFQCCADLCVIGDDMMGFNVRVNYLNENKVEIVISIDALLINFMEVVKKYDKYYQMTTYDNGFSRYKFTVDRDSYSDFKNDVKDFMQKNGIKKIKYIFVYQNQYELVKLKN